MAAPIEGMLLTPFLDAYHISGTAPVFPIPRLGQPAQVAGAFSCLLTALLGAVALVKGGFGIRREPLVTVDAFLFGMLFSHPAFLSTASRHSPRM